MPEAEAMAAPLAESRAGVAEGAPAVVVLDQAGDHGPTALKVPDHLTLLPRPSGSPALNPVETVWDYRRQTWLSLRVWADDEAIVETCCTAWNTLMSMPDRLASMTRRDWATQISN